MQLNTKLNVGDSVWYVSSRDGCVRETTITGITIVHKPTHYLRGECQTKIVYESKDNCNFAEENEGQFWFSSRKDIINHLTKILGEMDNGKKSSPIATPQKDNLSEAFEEFFGDAKPKPVEKFRIVMPPSIQRGIARLAKKDRCDCGIHRISKLARKFKKLPSTHDKTLTEYADEL